MAAKNLANGARGGVMSPPAGGASQGILIPRPNVQTVKIPIVGISSLIMHKFSSKARKMMLDKQTKQAKTAKAAKVPDEDYKGSMYVAEPDKWYGMPATSFKAAAVGACRLVDGLTMTSSKLMFFVEPDGRTAEGDDLVKIIGDPRMREDIVRLESGVADVRHRAEFVEWSAELTVTFNADALSVEQLVNLFSLAGEWVGIGDWRPSSPKSASGTHGRFRVRTDA